MVYQDPGSALNPTVKIGRQVAEAFTVLGHDRADAVERARAALDRVRIADPDRVMQRYPHQLSGGMQQRVVIAMALACDPQLLVLDEPTTGLDATVEAEVLDLVRALRSETDAAILLIAHNLGVIRSMCDRVGVMYAGRIVEEGDAIEVFEQPEAPVHDRNAGVPSAARRAQDRTGAVHDPGHAAADRDAPADVRVRRPLRARRRDVPDRGAADRRRQRGHLREPPHQPVPSHRPAPPGAGSADRGCPRPAQGLDRDDDDRCLQDVPPARPRRPGARRDPPRPRRRRDPRPGRRVRIGQDDARQGVARNPRARCRQRDQARRAPPRRQGRQSGHRGHAGDADGVPEPGQRAEPGVERAPNPDAHDQEAHRHHGRGRRPAARTR